MASNSKLKLKLLIEKRSQKVLFAEAGKHVADFLFSLKALPIGTVIKLITKESMAGSLGATYGSLDEWMGPICSLHKPNHNFSILPAAVPLPSRTGPYCFSATDTPTVVTNKKREYYRCPGSNYSYLQSNMHNYITDAFGTHCPKCGRGMIIQVQMVGAGSSIKEVKHIGEKGVVC